MNNLKLTTRDQGGVTILSCNGRVVFGDESSALRDMVKGLIAEGKSNIVINLGGVSYIDSGGLGTLVSLFTSARAAVVLRRQPHRKLAHVRITERIVFENLRGVLEHDQRAGATFGSFEGHRHFS